MKIEKITIIPDTLEIERCDIEDLRRSLIKQLSGKVYFETSGETVADFIIEKELKNKMK